MKTKRHKHFYLFVIRFSSDRMPLPSLLFRFCFFLLGVLARKRFAVVVVMAEISLVIIVWIRFWIWNNCCWLCLLEKLCCCS